MQRIVRTLFVVAAILGVSGCCKDGSSTSEKNPEVSVVCQVIGGTVNCTATEVQGTTSVKTCWNVTLNCKSGSSSSASACENVSAAKPAIHTLTEDEFKDIKTCQVASLNVHNVKVTKD